MKNPVLLFARCVGTWLAMREFPGVFSFPDACKQLLHVLQPGRITESSLKRFIRYNLDICTLPDGVHEIRIKDNGLMFYWRGQISGGLASSVLQELDTRNPHCYTTPPVHLTPASVILDVGACEGLFAFRVVKAGQAAKVVCFEPSPRTASLLQRAAEKNGVAGKLDIRICAVGRTSGEIYFTDSETPEGNRVVSQGTAGANRTRQVSLDDFCQENKIRLTAADLLKVDAEGSDVDVIKGAEGIIRAGAPQIAVTTYHNPAHAAELIGFLRSVQPRYQLRLKGLALWYNNRIPRPVLLQASLRGDSRLLE